MSLCSCYSNIGKSSFFLYLHRIKLGTVAGENVFLCAYNKHGIKLQTLCGVHCHKHRLVVIGFKAVHIRNKRYLL